MKKHSVFTLLGSFLLLLVTAALFFHDDEKAFLPNFDAEKVYRIEFEHLSNGIQLTREGQRWHVAQLAEGEANSSGEVEWFPADRGRVHAALGSFGGLGQGVLVSENPQKQKIYRVDITGAKLRFFDHEGEKIAEVVIGKNGPDSFSNYVRLEGDNKVYLVDRSLQGLFSIDVEDFKQRDDVASE